MSTHLFPQNIDVYIASSLHKLYLQVLDLCTLRFEVFWLKPEPDLLVLSLINYYFISHCFPFI
jgi:hypothetical protein